MAEGAIIPVIFDVSQPKTAISELVKDGAISEASAKMFKAGNDELAKRKALLTDAVRGNEQVNKAEQQQLTIIKDIQKATAQMSGEFLKGIADGLKEVAEETGQSSEELITALGSLGDISDQVEAALAGVTDEIAGTVAGLDELGGATGTAGKALGGVGEEAGAVGGELDDMSNAAGDAGEALGGVGDTANDVNKKLKSLKAQKRELTEQIATLIDAGETESDTFRELVARAGEIDDAIGDAAGAISRAGSDTRGLDNVIQLASGITAGFSIAQGAAALFGDESEDLQKALLKVNAAMAILNGLQQIQAIIRDESIKTLVLEWRTRLINNAQIAIENGLQSKSVIVRTAATAAQWALNAAMAASPLGAIAAVLAVLIVAFTAYELTIGDVTAEEERRESALKTMNEAQKEATKTIGEDTGQLNIWLATAANVNLRNDERIAALKKIREQYPEYLNFLTLESLGTDRAATAIRQQIELIKQKAIASAAEEIYKKRLEEQIEAQRRYNAEVEKTGGFVSAYADELKDKATSAAAKADGAFDALNDVLSQQGGIARYSTQQLQQFLTVLNQLDGRISQKILDFSRNAISNVLDQRTASELQKELELLQKQTEAKVLTARNGSSAELAAKREAAKVSRDLDIKNAEDTIVDAKQLINEKILIEARYHDAIEALDKAAADRARDANVRRLQTQKDLIDVLLINAKKGTEQELDLQIKSAEKQKEISLAGLVTENKTTAQVQKERKAITERSEEEILKLRKEYGYKQAQAVAEIQLLGAQQRLAMYREGTDKYFAAQRDVLKQQAEYDTLSIQQSEDSELLKSEKIRLININLNKELDQLGKKQQQQAIDRQNKTIAALQALRLTRLKTAANDPTLNDVGKFRAQQAIRTQELADIDAERARMHQKALDDQYVDFQDYQNDLTANTEQQEQKRAEIQQAYAERQKELYKQIGAAILQTLGTAVNAAFDVQKARRDDDLQQALQNIEEERSTALDNKNLTEQQKSNIQKKYDAKERQLKREAAKKERDAEVNKAIAQGILAAITSYANFGFPYGLIAAAASAAATGIYIVELENTPIPSYRTGRKGGRAEYAEVNEAGPEVIKDKKGNYRMAGKGKRTVTYLHEGDTVYTADESKHLMKKMDVPNSDPETLSEYSIGPGGAVEFDYDRAGQSFAKYMPELVSVNMTADEDGLHTFFTKKGYRQEIKNKMYSFRK